MLCEMQDSLASRPLADRASFDRDRVPFKASPLSHSAILPALCDLVVRPVTLVEGICAASKSTGLHLL